MRPNGNRSIISTGARNPVCWYPNDPFQWFWRPACTNHLEKRKTRGRKGNQNSVRELDVFLFSSRRFLASFFLLPHRRRVNACTASYHPYTTMKQRYSIHTVVYVFIDIPSFSFKLPHCYRLRATPLQMGWKLSPRAQLGRNHHERKPHIRFIQHRLENKILKKRWWITKEVVDNPPLGKQKKIDFHRAEILRSLEWQSIWKATEENNVTKKIIKKNTEWKYTIKTT